MKEELLQKEKEILDFWKKSKIFQKSLLKKKRNFVFFEGPPTANAKPGIHHVLTRVYKDIICRFKSMQGYKVIRKAGWDTHGLPVELEIEKKLGLKNKKEIEEYGIERFNQKCKESVWEYVQDWQDLTEKIGFWLDMENPYVTYDPSYIETLWWIVKEIAKKNLLYQDFKVVPYCPRCGTPLSSHELAQGYKRIKEPAIYVKFQIKDKKEKVYLLVWTTTPWTLPANVAIAVHPELTYILAKKEEDYYILLESKKDLLGEGVKIVEKFKGKKLEGVQYEPLFPKEIVEINVSSKNLYKVLLADFVSEKEGTGLVHIAPAFGEEDMNLIKKQNENIKSQDEKFPIILTVDEDGRFKESVKKWKGMFVKEADPLIIDHLKEDGKIFKVEEYEHDYPFCWRCKTPLLYYAKKSWFVAMTKVKDELLKNNQRINWIPTHIKEGRFGQWLKDVKDWAFSRERYWGTPLPVWICQNCGFSRVIGSRKDLLTQKFSTNIYYLLRHPESENLLQRVYSSYPESRAFSLTKRGKKEAEKLANEFEKIGIDLIFSSDLARCKETAQIIAHKLKKEVVYDKRLREIDQGIFNEKPIKEAKKFWDPEGKLTPLEFTKKRMEIPAPKGESFLDVRKRVLDFMKEIEQKYQNKKILIISHEIPLLMIESSAKGFNELETAECRIKRKIKAGEIRKIEWKTFPYNSEGKLDFHRPYVDQIIFICPKCKGKMKRVKEVIDVWFDSGSMPFAQWHYPFENKKLIERKIQFPADYICEAIDQTRGWFYTLLAVSTLLGFGAPYKNVLVLGHVLDEKGEKMSKSKGNVVDPWQMLQKYGADAIRWYFFTINPPDYPKLFKEADIDISQKRFLFTYYNCYKFLKTYAPKLPQKRLKFERLSLLDYWILSRLSSLIEDVTDKLEKFDIVEAAKMIEDFVVNDLSLWYIRRSRLRFQRPKDKKEFLKAATILKYVLEEVSKISAPFVPFISEAIYQGLGPKKESVHLEDWPKSNKKLIQKNLEKEMNLAREIVSLALKLRSEAKIKIRQPLLFAQIKLKKRPRKEIIDLIKDEVNLKEIRFVKRIKKRKNFVLGKEKGIEMALNIEITPDLKKEGMIREFVRLVQDLRKKARLTPREKINVYLKSSQNLWESIQDNLNEILPQIKAENVKMVKEALKTLEFLGTKEAKIDGESIFIGIIKVK